MGPSIACRRTAYPEHVDVLRPLVATDRMKQKLADCAQPRTACRFKRLFFECEGRRGLDSVVCFRKRGQRQFWAGAFQNAPRVNAPCFVHLTKFEPHAARRAGNPAIQWHRLTEDGLRETPRALQVDAKY